MRVAPAVCLMVAALVLTGCGFENLDPLRSDGDGSSGPPSEDPPPPPPPPPPDPPPDPPPPPPGPTPTVLRTATFVSANGYITRGTVQIVQIGASYELRFGSDFYTNDSGALDVRLCNGPYCVGAFLSLGTLRSSSGAQTYPLPDDGSAYGAVVIWCRAVSLPFGVGTLR